MELAHLRLAERHIADGELRIAAQAALVEKLRTRNYPLPLAEDYLALLRTTMLAWHAHRDLILSALNG
jgi:hypothetical protein